MWADFLRLQGSHRARTDKFLSAKAVIVFWQRTRFEPFKGVL